MQVVTAHQKCQRVRELPRQVRIKIEIGELNVFAHTAGIIGRILYGLQKATETILTGVRHRRGGGPLSATGATVESPHDGSAVIVQKRPRRILIAVHWNRGRQGGAFPWAG